MSLSINYLYQFALKLIRKNQAGSLSSTEFAFHWNDQSNAIFGDLVGRFQAQNTGKEGANTGLIENKTILQKLAPFIKPDTLTIAAGNSDKPADFVYQLALRINGYDVIPINHDQQAAVNNSVIDAPSVANNKYYFTEYEDYYSFLPSTVTSAALDYIRLPKDVVWGYNLDPAGRQVYNPGTSVQPEWDELTCREITKRILKNLGVSLHDADFSGFGQQVIATGN